MRNSADSFQRIGYRHLFGRPALEKNRDECATRRERVERKSIAMLNEGERAYLETRDVLDAYPGRTSDVLEAVADHERAAARGADR